MAIAQDASTPAVRQTSASSGTATSNSFSPPAGSWVYVPVNWLFGPNTVGQTLTCSDNHGNSLERVVSRQDADGATINAVFRVYYATAPGSTTLTISCSSTASADAQIAPLVLTGAATDQSGAASATFASSGTSGSWTGSITTTTAGSWVILAAAASGGETLTAASNTTLISAWNDATAGDSGAVGRQTTATVTPGATTYGFNSSSSSFRYGWAAAELVPSGTAPPTAPPAILTHFTYPETWQVGDDLDANTLNRRLRDQNNILLRRPLLVARMTAAQTITNSNNQALNWDTLDQDDDGMALDNTGSVYTNFVAQREGVYQFWLNLAMTGNGSGTTSTSWQTSIWINGTTTRRWDLQIGTTPTSGKLWYHSQTGLISLAQGESVNARTFQNTGASLTLPGSSNGCPRLVIMWLGIS